MKDFKIDAFDKEKLKKQYKKMRNTLKVSYSTNEKLFFDCTKSKDKIIEVSFFWFFEFDDHSISDETPYISEKWELFTKEQKEIMETSESEYETWEKSNKELILKKTCDNFKVYEEKWAEKSFRYLENLWFIVIGYWWVHYHLDKSNDGYDNYSGFSFIIEITDKENFLNKTIIYLKKTYQSSSKEQTLKRWKQMIIDIIEKSSIKTETENIPLYNKEEIDGFEILVLLLHLEKEIFIKKYWESFIVNRLNNSSNAWLQFNKNNWEITKDWKSIWKISLKTRQFLFFHYLYKNIWKCKIHEEIVKEWIGNKSLNQPYSQYLSSIKSKLDDEVKKLIEAETGWYIIRK